MPRGYLADIIAPVLVRVDRYPSRRIPQYTRRGDQAAVCYHRESIGE